MKKIKLKWLAPALLPLILCMSLRAASAQLLAQSASRPGNEPVSLTRALKTVTKVFDTKFVYEKSLLEGKTTSYDLKNIRGKQPEEVLKAILYPKGLVFLYVKQNYYTIVSKDRLEENGGRQEGAGAAHGGAQAAGALSAGNGSLPFVQQSVPQHTVTGKVTDSTGKALIGVSVKVEGTGKGTVTDMKGAYTLDAVPDDAVLVFSYIGFSDQKMPVQGKDRVDIVLHENNTGLNEIIVVGYGTQKKLNLTGAVDQVSGDVLENRSIPNLSQGLQGVIPNLNIVPQDGKPIQSPEYNIRGTTSIGQGGSALVLIDGVEGDPSLINPADIASISVLKDAASAAIYGARGAFGVVLITTKDPAKGKTSITYSANYSIKKPTAYPHLVTNGYEWAKTFNEAWTAWNDYSQTPQNVNKTLKFSQEYLAELKRHNEDPSLPKIEVNDNGEYVYYENTSWYEQLYKNSNSATDQNISISGSSGNASFYVTGRYFGQEGLFRYNSDDYKIYNLRAKGSVQLYPWLRIDNNTDFSSMTYHNPLNVGEGGGIWRNIADEGHPMAPLLNPDGTLSYSAAYTVGDFYYGKNGIDMTNRVIKNTSAFTARFFDDKLTVKGDFTFQNTNDNDKQTRVQVPYSRKPGVIEYVGTNYNDLQETYRETQYLATNIYASYETNFSKDHYIKVMAGYNFEQSTYKRLQARRNGLIYEDVQDISLALGQAITTDGGWERWDILGGFYRLNYAYKDRYLVEVDGRYDGSSKFPENQRYGFFPSVSAGWRISNESFWKISPKAISNLKIRGSYGSLGNGNIASYSFQENFDIRQSGRVLGGIRPQKTDQPNVIPDGLTWETSTTRDLGLDLSALSDRLSFTGDIYTRNTTDMFTFGVQLPAVFGTNVPKGNYADLTTKGWELTVGWRDRFAMASKPFNYGIRVSLADYQSTITKYNNLDKKLNDYYPGQTLGEIWGYVTDGYFTSQEEIENSADQSLIKASTSGQLLPGDIKFKDISGPDGKPDGVINNGDNTVDSPGDMKIIGNSTPRYTYGINLDADWNNFFFSVFFQGVGKQDWWPGREADVFWGQYNRPYNDPLISQTGNMWSEDNPNAYFPRLRGYVAQGAGRELSTVQTKYLQNVAYLRLKNIQIGYNLPHSFISRIKMNNARIYLSGENLWTWSPLYRITKNNMDVEAIHGSDQLLTNGGNGNGNNYPILKSVTIGLSVTF